MITNIWIDLQFQRDIGVWNRKMYIANPPLVKEDMHIKEFRRYMLQFYSKSSLPCQYKLKLEKGLLDFWIKLINLKWSQLLIQ